MKRKLQHLLLGLWVLMFLSVSVMAQEVYFSISGKNVTFDSGDRIGEYDYWFRPKPGIEQPREVIIEIFDAGLGGFADVVFRDPNTRTSYGLYPFDALYELGNRSISARSGDTDGALLEEITAFTETRFLNRWVPFFTLQNQETSENGFIMRVRTDDGNDINNFRIRLTGAGAADWELITLNLSAGLIGSQPENRFQFRPLWNDAPIPELILSGEEDTEVFIFDAFGEQRSVRRGWQNFQEERFGKPNYWGIVMTGSRQRINNRTLIGQNEIVPFYFDPIVLQESETEQPVIRQLPGNTCNSVIMETETRSFYLNSAEAEWIINGRTFRGNRFQYEFPEAGTFPFVLLIPTRGLHVPGYVVHEGEITVNALPVVVFNDFPRVVSPGQSIILDASGSYDPEGRPLRYQWLLNGSFRSNASRFRFSSTISGRYEIKLVLDDTQPDAFCTQTTEIIEIIVNTQPYAEIEAPRVIAPGVANQVFVRNDTDADGDSLAFRWEVSDQSEIQTGRNAVIQHERPGTYTVRLTADDETGTLNATFSTSVSYKVNAAPIPRFQIAEIEAPGESVTLDARRSSDPDGDPLTFAWYISDGRSLEGPYHQITFDEPGDYKITLTVNDGEEVENSIQTLQRELRINHAPVPIITATNHTNTSIVPFSAQESFDTDQTIVRWLWDFGDGNRGNGEEITHTYRRHGTYEVTLTVDDGMNVSNSVQSVSKTVIVNKNPSARITAPTLVAAGQTFNIDGSESFDEDGSVTSWRWFLNGNPIDSTQKTSLRIQEPGLYSLALEVRDDTPFEDAYDVATKTIRVNHPPVPVWTASPEITEPNRETVFNASQSFDFDNESLTFRWDFSDGVTLQGETVRRQFEEPGTYFFTLYADDGEGLENSVSSTEGEIRVNFSPIIVTETLIRSNNKKILLDASESYNPDGENLSFTWVLPDGSIRRDASFLWQAPEPGVHEISLQVNDLEGLGNSITSQRIIIMINRPPVPVTDALIQSCTDQLIIFSSAQSFDPDGDGFTTFWEFGDGSSSYEANPVHSYPNPGLYLAQLTLHDGFANEPSIQQIPVRIEGSPLAVIREPEMTVCAATPVQFDGSLSTDPNGQVGSFSWDFGDGSTAVGERPTHLFTRPGTYRVSLTITGSGTGRCPNVSQAIALVRVVAAPTAVFEIPEVVSPGTQITLDARESTSEDEITSYTWNITRNGQEYGSFSGEQHTFTPSQPGDYEVTLTIVAANEAGCSTNSKTRRVHVNKAPEIAWNLPEVWPQNIPFRLSAEGSNDDDGFITSYVWKMNGEQISKGITANLPVDAFGEFEVSLIITDNSGVSNSVVDTTGIIVIQPAPTPDFSLPDTLYRGETVRFSPITVTDPAGNQVRSDWLKDGEVLETPQFIAKNARYQITLLQNNGLELPNSVSNTIKTLHVIQPPTPKPTLPFALLKNREISMEAMNLPQHVVILDNNDTPITAWKPEAAGTGIIRLGWIPRGAILEKFQVSVPVLDVLEASFTEKTIHTVFNPVNRYIQVKAPDVNRDANYVVTYEWRRKGSQNVIQSGKLVSLPLQKGTNEFEILIRDDARIPNGEQIQATITIIAE